ITVDLGGRHAARFRRGRLAREPVPVESSQIWPPRVRDAIIGARAAFERADARAPADLALATEAAEVMGSLTESTELAQALLARPVLARAALTPSRPPASSARVLPRLPEHCCDSGRSGCRATGPRRRDSTRVRPRRCARCCSRS